MRGIIAWFAKNGVAANLLMVGIIAAGVIITPTIKREVFPELPTEMISISVLYPGAAPEEVEEGIILRIEEAVQSLEGVKRIRSTARENQATVTVEALDGADVRQLLDEVKSRVDAIDTFPDEAEQPVIAEVLNRQQVINLAISGDTDEETLKHYGERIRDQLLKLPGITQVDLANVRPYEISIEVSEEALRRHGLTFGQVADAVRRSSVDLPGGSVKTQGGEILLRAKGQAYRGREFEDLVLLTDVDGTRVTLGDVATVVDGFAETDQEAFFNGGRSAMLQVFRVGNQDAIDLTDTVKEYAASAQLGLPEGLSLTVWQDESVYLKGRQDLLIRNGRAGFLMVFLVLALFLRFRLALWVAVGVPLSFLGALALLPMLGVSINLISLFAFIIVLGIVVDDAIVVGEAVYRQIERGKSGVEAAVKGTNEVLVPVTFAILTTVAAFTPLLIVPGEIGQIMGVIPLIVIPVLLFSYLESKLVLPNHLSHLDGPSAAERIGRVMPARVRHGFGYIGRGWTRLQRGVDRGLKHVIENVYRPHVTFLLKYRYATLAAFAFVLLTTVGLIGYGAVKFVFFPKVESDTIRAVVVMPEGTPVEVTRRAVLRLEEAAGALRNEYGSEFTDNGETAVRNVLASVGSQPISQASSGGPNGGGGFFTDSHLGEVAIELVPSEKRTVSSETMANRWRELTGPIPDALELTFNASLFSAGSPIDIQLIGPNLDELGIVAQKIKSELPRYAGVTDITDDYRSGKREIKLSIKPEAEVLGLSQADLARQVRQAFYGEEAQRVQRGREEVKVMVRYPEEDRRTLATLENMRIRTPDGREVPFGNVAQATVGQGYSAINRSDRARTISVRADVDPAQGNANEILAEVEADVLPRILADHPGVTYSLEGEQQEQREAMGGIFRGFVFALLIIYGLMAIPFRSYTQPLVVMTAIPFGIIGAVWGHMLMGKDLTILSMFGIVALTGVVVNDSIVLVDYINRHRRKDDDRTMLEAVRDAGAIRFRAILLTSLTTFAGLTPMLLERSVQAQFLVPIAISLGFGVLFATLITLVMVPATYVISEDIHRLGGRLGRWVTYQDKKGERGSQDAAAPGGVRR